MKRRDVFTPRCNTQVEETGCEILPDFADGAKLLVPINKWWTVQSECGMAISFTSYEKTVKPAVAS